MFTLAVTALNPVLLPPAQPRPLTGSDRGQIAGVAGADPAAFMFNSINAVLSLIRDEPKQAEETAGRHVPIFFAC